MTVIITTLVKPIVGKTKLAEGRVRKAAEIFTSHGGKCRVTRSVLGGMSGAIGLQSATPDFTTAMSVMSAGMNDPAFQNMMEERESNPAGEMSGPIMFRTIYGDIAWDTHPVSMMRIYRMARKNVPAAVSLLEEVDALSDEINMVGVAPIVNDDMEIFNATYQFKSLTDYGAQVDQVGMSAEYQAIVIRANDLGTIISSAVYMTM